MKYSRFDAARAVYDVFEDSSTRPLNADLPVPAIPAPTNGIGIPAMDTGRPLPSGARHIGESWHAVGMVVTSGRSTSLSGSLADEPAPTWLKFAAVGAVALAVAALVARSRA